MILILGNCTSNAARKHIDRELPIEMIILRLLPPESWGQVAHSCSIDSLVWECIYSSKVIVSREKEPICDNDMLREKTRRSWLWHENLRRRTHSSGDLRTMYLYKAERESEECCLSRRSFVDIPHYFKLLYGVDGLKSRLQMQYKANKRSSDISQSSTVSRREDRAFHPRRRIPLPHTYANHCSLLQSLHVRASAQPRIGRRRKIDSTHNNSWLQFNISMILNGIRSWMTIAWIAFFEAQARVEIWRKAKLLRRKDLSSILIKCIRIIRCSTYVRKHVWLINSKSSVDIDGHIERAWHDGRRVVYRIESSLQA